MTVRGRACMRVCAFMNWFINHVMMESMKYIITSACLSVFLYLPIIYAHIRTHTHTYMYVCVCLDAFTFVWNGYIPRHLGDHNKRLLTFPSLNTTR